MDDSISKFIFLCSGDVIVNVGFLVNNSFFFLSLSFFFFSSFFKKAFVIIIYFDITLGVG